MTCKPLFMNHAVFLSPYYRQFLDGELGLFCCLYPLLMAVRQGGPGGNQTIYFYLTTYFFMGFFIYEYIREVQSSSYVRGNLVLNVLRS